MFSNKHAAYSSYEDEKAAPNANGYDFWLDSHRAAIPEVEVYVQLLVLIWLLDSNKTGEAVECAGVCAGVARVGCVCI